MASLSLKGVLSLDGRGFHSAIKDAQKATGQLGAQGFGALKNQIAAAFSVGAIIAFTKSMADMSGQIKDTAERLGVSMGFLQEGNFAATRGGSNAEQFATGMEKLAAAMQKIRDGDGEKQLDVLERYGIALSDIESKSPEEIFKQLGTAMESVTVSAQTTADMIDIFGKSGGRLIPVLKSLREDSAKLRGSFNFMDDDEIQKWDTAGKKIDDIGASLKLMAGRLAMFATDSDFRADLLSELFKTEDDQRAANRIAMAGGAEPEKPATKPDMGTATQEQKDALARAEHQREMDELVESQAKTAEINERLRQSQMTDEEKINELIARRAQIYAQINSLQFAPGTLGRGKLDLELANVNQSLFALRGDKGKGESVSSFSAGAPSGDALVRVGNFLGNGGSATLASINQKMLDELRGIRRDLRSVKPSGSDSSLSNNSPS